MDLVSKVTLLLSVLTVAAQILVILGLINLFSKRKIGALNKLFVKLSGLVFVVPLIAMAGSLFFSEVARFTPCVLCWYQRILMYPQAIVLAIAYFRKDKSFNYYSVILSAIGGGIAFYHYLLQRGIIKEIVPCSFSPQAVDCAAKVNFTFGYISIPMMALSAFLLIIILQIHNLGLNKKK